MQNNLFQPLRIGPRELRNRIIFGSHTTNYAQHNLLSNRHADYYAARAEGGAGTIVLEEHIVHPSDLPYANAPLGYLPETPAAIANVAERIHAHNSLVLVQLNHNGQQSTSNHSQQELWAPSAVPDVASREMPKVMEPPDIQAVTESIRLCISCNQYCIGRMGLNLSLGCIQTPATGNEQLFPALQQLQALPDDSAVSPRRDPIHAIRSLWVSRETKVAQKERRLVIVVGGG